LFFVLITVLSPEYTRPVYTLHINTIANNVSILLAWLSAAGKEVVLYLVARKTLKKKLITVLLENKRI
jgi:hypothetical protein